MKLFVVLVVGLGALAQAQQQQQSPQEQHRTRAQTTPVPILKQINKMNEDGSYTYGYENADGSYKIETKDTNGQVQGKYGYYDDAGTLREIEYGASRAGFYPQGTDIKAPEVAPPRDDPNDPQDGNYYPELYTDPYQPQYDPSRASSASRTNQLPQFGPRGRRIRVKVARKLQDPAAAAPTAAPTQPQQQAQYYQAPQFQQPQYQAQPQQYQQPQYQQPQQQYQQQALPSYYQQHQNIHEQFLGHPARNVDLNTGSYSISYTG